MARPYTVFAPHLQRIWTEKKLIETACAKLFIDHRLKS